MKSKTVLLLSLLLMGGLILTALLFPQDFKGFLYRPALYPHTLFVHIFSVTLFFANGVVGMLWEYASLRSGRKEVILHTYNTVSRLDARFSSPLIILSLLSGLMLTTLHGDIWQIGWLALSFLLFILSGIVWISLDIPTQYKIKQSLKTMESDENPLPAEFIQLLRKRLFISLAGMIPLLMVFILMVYKPEINLIPAFSPLAGP
ncbi:MAG: DUF2269 family protein [Spirochaetales bacterium]|nr:DUF2269 family protein [Spirochaetales bacterium]